MLALVEIFVDFHDSRSLVSHKFNFTFLILRFYRRIIGYRVADCGLSPNCLSGPMANFVLSGQLAPTSNIENFKGENCVETEYN